MTKYKLVIPIKGNNGTRNLGARFKSLEADYSNHLARSLVASYKKFLLLPEYVMTRLSLLTRDVSSRAPRNRQPQGCDTTRPNSSTENLPHWNMQGHDGQHGSVKKQGCRVWQQRLPLSLTSSLLASFVGKDYTNFSRTRARTPNASHSFRMLVLLSKTSHPRFIATGNLTEERPVMLQWKHSRM